MSQWPRHDLAVARLRVAGEQFAESASLLVGRSKLICDLRAEAPLLARWPEAIALEGETGTGKSLLFEEIARHLPPGTRYARRSASTLNHNLVRSELFGFRKGAYTGAHADTPGLLELLDVLFLDDAQDMDEELQLILLDVVEGKPFWAILARRPISPRVRIIVGTQRPLAWLRAKGRLREDLFARLSGVTCRLSPLAARREDILPLTDHMLRGLAARLHTPVPEVEPAAMSLLEAHSWPQNVRELQRALEVATYHAWRRDAMQVVIEARDLPDAIRQPPGSGRRGRPPKASVTHVADVFGETGSIDETARRCGLSTRTVQRRMHAE